MQNLNKFTPEVCDKLGHYVYGLIDPRNGRYFYIGKGQNNRVFDHITEAHNVGQDAQRDKHITIRQYRARGF